MIDIQCIRLDKTHVVQALHTRGIEDAEQLVELVYRLDVEKRAIQFKLENLVAKLHKLSKEIGIQLRIQGDVISLKEEVSRLKEEIKQLTQQLKAYESNLLEKCCQLPNLPHMSVPIGQSSADNQVAYKSVSIKPGRQLDYFPHWDLLKKHDLVDFELGSKITAAGFPIYKGKGAGLQRALINFFLDRALMAGYTEIQPPILVNSSSAYGTGQLPDKEKQMYHVSLEDMYLIPTAEVPITNIYRNCMLLESTLPIKHVGYTPCFRREAGSWGAHVRGLNRLHQFDKVELVQICQPAYSYVQLEEMLVYVRGLVEQLGLPYRVLKLCTGDLGFSAAMTYDIEVYSVGQDKWLEVSSISNFETFQSNRLALRYKDRHKKNGLLHTLNGSALALPRILAALVEWYQDAAVIHVPEVLQPYTGFSEIT